MTSDPNLHYPMPYSYYNNVGGYGGSGPAWWGGLNIPASCTGTITTTYVWFSEAPGDDPPPAVVVMEHCAAWWTSGHMLGSGFTNACDNGWGDAAPIQHLLPDWFPWQYDMATSEGTHSRLIPHPGQFIILERSPNVSLAGSGSPTDSGQGVVNVSYNASIYPITMDVSGTTKDDGGGDNILIGQGCSAGFDSLAGVEFINTQWTVNGDKFASFDMAPDQSWGHVTLCDDAIWSSPSPHWYWSKEGDGTVSGTTTVIANGQSIGDVTDTKPVTVWTPYSKLFADPGPVSYTAGQNSVIAGGPTMNPPGIVWRGAVGTEDMFLGSGPGKWAFLQLLWLDRVQYTFLNPVGFAVKTNSALDGSFPYGSTYDANSQADNSTFQSEDDSPQQGFNPDPHSFSIADTYKQYMMYQPPNKGLGVQWVPLQSLLWHWTVFGSRWPLLPFAPDPPQGSVSPESAVTEHQHPAWTTVFAGHN